MWSSASETALADAFRFAGEPVPDRGLVLGRGTARMRTVRLGGPLERSIRRSAADAGEGDDVHLYRDSSAAPLLDLRRRLEAIMDGLDGIIRHGVSLSRSVELLLQWDRVLGLGLLGPVTWDDSFAARSCGLGESRRLVGGLYCRLSDFIRRVVVHRRDVAITSWRSWLREDPRVHPYKWLRSDLMSPAPFLQCEPRLTPCGSGVLANLVRIDEEFRKAWLPYLRPSGQRETSLEEFNREVEDFLPLLPEVSLLGLTLEMLADIVRRNGATAVSLEGWDWGELKALFVAWYDGLARILT